MRFILVTLFLFVALMAGCVGGEGDDPEGEGPGTSQPTEDTGSITGQVFDVDLNPLGGARISLISPQGQSIRNETAGEDGSFVVNNVEPATYRLTASAFCCEEGVASVTVVANEEVQQSFRLKPFSQDDLKIPYEVTDDHVAFIACQFTLPNNQSSGCGVVSGNVPNKAVTTGIGLRTIVAAMQWDGGTGAAGAQDLQFQIRNKEGEVYAYASGSSPLEVRVDNSETPGSVTPFEEFDEEGLLLELSAQPAPGTLVYQQAIHYYWYLHYWQEGPDGVTALPDQ